MPIAGINIEWLLIVVIGVVGMLVQWRLQSVFTKYSQVRTSNGMTGRDVAEKMLRDNGIYDVRVTSTPGHLTDHYNPADKTVNLSESVYNSPSIAAAAVAAHECGHAVHAISQSMRSDLVAHGIKVSEVRPGMVETEFSVVRFHGDEERAKGVYRGVTPLTGSDIAEVIGWIVSQPAHVNIDDVLVTPQQQANAYLTVRK